MIRSVSTPLQRVLIGAAVICGLSLTAKSQIFFNNGAQIYSAPLAIIQVNGGIENNSSTSNGNIDHNGTMTVTLNSILPNPGDVILNNNSTWQGDGTTRLEGDWNNNAIFQEDLSTVEMYASVVQQQITGTVNTTFHNLTLTGTGTGANRIKLQTLDASIDATGILNVNDRELATDINNMFVLNPSLNAVDNDSVAGSEGFVSSLAPGVLSRVTNSTGSYNYPVGSSVVLTRYRPIRLAPQATTAETYTVRFVNHDADVDGFLRTSNDGSMCLTIDTFYHAIDRITPFPTGIPADIRTYYVQATDGNWGGMAQWRTNNSMWNDMLVVTNSTSNGFNTMTRPNWLFANLGDPYLLTQKRPAAPTIVCPTICENGNGTFTVNGGGPNYVWTTPNGTVITSGQGTGSITVGWGTNTGTVYVIDTTNGSVCASLPDSCIITPMLAPVAGFDTVSFGNYSTDYQFTDTSTGGTIWFWDFGDGSTSTLQNPIHTYGGAGTYVVMQIVTNAAGCIDTIYTTVVVTEGILIPNVFTPDGDGINDEFYIPSSGFESFKIEIFNRWGTKIWEASAGEIRWDGHSTSGQMMSDGTYYYILSAFLKSQSGPKDYSAKGFVTLLTKSKK